MPIGRGSPAPATTKRENPQGRSLPRRSGLGYPSLSMTPRTRSPRPATPLTLVALAALLSSAYFYQAGGWNQNARFDLTRAIAERGTIAIDAYHRNTGDKSQYAGHFYSDKAPGQSLLAVPIVWLAHVSGADLGRPADNTAASYVATVLTSALPAASMVLLLGQIVARRGRSCGAAVFAALALSLAPPRWAYATLFMGHTLGAACLLAALAAAEALPRRAQPGRDLALGAALGASAGWAVVTEYTALAPAAMIALYGLWQIRAEATRRLGRFALGVAMTAAPCAWLLLAYQQAAFGSPFATPIEYLYGFEKVRTQPFSLPRGEVLVELFVGTRRGLLPLAPVLIASLAGFVALLKRPETRPLGLLCVAIATYYALMNAAFATPLAGWSYGPRYMAAALPFWALGLVWAWDLTQRASWRALLVALLLWGAGASLVAVSTTVQPPHQFERPMAELMWPAFAAGDLSLNHMSFLEARSHPAQLRGGTLAHDAFNLGELLGLRGHASLVPLFVAWGALGGLAWRRHRTPGPAEAA